MLLDRLIVICFLNILFFNNFLFGSETGVNEIYEDYSSAEKLIKENKYKKAEKIFSKVIEETSGFMNNRGLLNQTELDEVKKIFFESKAYLVDINLNDDLFKNKQKLFENLKDLNRAFDYSYGKMLTIQGAISYVTNDIEKARFMWETGAKNGGQVYEEGWHWAIYNNFLNNLYFNNPLLDEIIIYRVLKLCKDNKLLPFYEYYTGKNNKYNWQKELEYGKNDDLLFFLAMKKKLKENDAKTAKEMLTKLKRSHKEKDIFYYLIDFELKKFK